MGLLKSSQIILLLLFENILKYHVAHLMLLFWMVLIINFSSLVSDPEPFIPAKYSVHKEDGDE